IKSSGYVVHTLEAALWCLLTHDTYAATVLAAVNLGDDTDTTGAVAGGLAGLAYGEAAMPAEWLAVLARRADIEELAARLVISA
ncbi:MAG: ADP-ribosylglycohydrolase family protein, partial [Hymenobacter sp.]